MNLGLRFLPVKDIIYSIIPTAGTYGSYINDMAPGLFPNVWIALAAGLLGSGLLLWIIRLDNIKKYKQSLAEILATGYFMNFTGKLGRLLRSKTPIEFSFPGNVSKTFTTDKISVEIGLPENINALNKYAENVEQKSDIVFVRQESSIEPFWLRAKYTGENLVIYEFPRTLFSLTKYLKDDFKDQKSAEKNSKEIYSYFHKKIEHLKTEYSGEIAGARLNFILIK